MNERNVLIHMIGVIISISAIFQSYKNDWSWIIFTPLIIILISIFVELNKEKISIITLAVGTLAIPYFAEQNCMDDLYPLFVFFISFIAPIMVYWLVLLSSTIDYHPKGLFLSASYIGVTITIFYSLILIFNISNYILSEENAGPQALVLIGAALLAMIPYHIWLTYKD